MLGSDNQYGKILLTHFLEMHIYYILLRHRLEFDGLRNPGHDGSAIIVNQLYLLPIIPFTISFQILESLSLFFLSTYKTSTNKALRSP